MFQRYVLASIVALVVDVGTLALGVSAFGWQADWASGVGYSVGAIVHYWLSREYVFSVGWLHKVRWVEFGAFVVSGLCGLAVTVVVVHVLSVRLGTSVAVAKGAAIILSFIAAYLLRSRLVFRPRVG